MGQNQPKSMFDNYYANKLRSKSPLNNIRQYENNFQENEYMKNDANNGLNNINDIKINENNEHSKEIENLIKEYKEKFGSDEELEKMLIEYNNNFKSNNQEENLEKANSLNNNSLEPIYTTKKSNNLKTNNQTSKNNSRRRDVHKGPTPTINDAPIILPKINKNYIRENRQLVIENKVPNKNKFIEEKNGAKHKDYGKVPDYIKKYELEREIMKDEIKKQEEASKCPKGTKLLLHFLFVYFHQYFHLFSH